MADGDNYADFADIEAILGFTLTATSKPNTTHLAILLTIIDKQINGVLRIVTNNADTSGYLRAKECEHAFKWINNVMAVTDPKAYGPMDVNFTETEKSEMRAQMSAWTAHSFSVGD